MLIHSRIANIRKAFLLSLLSLVFLLIPSTSANADLYSPPKTSPCFKNEIFTTPQGVEPSFEDWPYYMGKETPKIREAIECLRYAKIVSDLCRRVTTENYFKEEIGGYCISIEDYCSLTGCNPEEKRNEIANLHFYSKSPFFNRERSRLSPIYKEIEMLGGVIGISKIIGLNFLLNLVFIWIILMVFMRAIDEKVSWDGLKFMGKVFLVTLIGFLTATYWVTYDKLYYPVTFLIMSSLVCLIVFRTVSFKKLKHKVSASIIFGVLSNPFWMLALRTLVRIIYK